MAPYVRFDCSEQPGQVRIDDDSGDKAVLFDLAGELTFAEQRRPRVTSLATELGLGTWDGPRADAWFAGYRQDDSPGSWPGFLVADCRMEMD